MDTGRRNSRIAGPAERNDLSLNHHRGRDGAIEEHNGRSKKIYVAMIQGRQASKLMLISFPTWFWGDLAVVTLGGRFGAPRLPY